MAYSNHKSARDFDRSYRRGAIMGLTVAEAFILLSFCLLLLFTWWQLDTEQKSLIAADKIGELNDTEKASIIASLSDGSFDAARQLRDAGFQPADLQAIQDTTQYSRFMREEDLKRLMKAVVKLSPETRLDLAHAVEVTDEAAVRAALVEMESQDDRVEQIAGRIEEAAQEQATLVKTLDDRLGATIRAAGGQIDARGTITLPDNILFAVNQSTIREGDEAFLSDFCATWIEALRGAGLNISELKIEGHASSEGQPNQTPEDAYLYNLNLSQERAQNVLGICLGGLDDPLGQQWARQHLAAIGYSSAHFIARADGTEDREASRRVNFSVSLDQERLIEDIKRDVAGTEVLMAAKGPARVIDGDTLEISGTSFRLSGIDAPERGQTCESKIGTVFDCGEAATQQLEEAIAGKDVDCKATETDQYRRPIALCRVGDKDLAAIMVVQGFAVPFLEYSDEYKLIGETAQTDRVGLWQTQFEMPWEYRKNH